jgi:hypothetical protein
MEAFTQMPHAQNGTENEIDEQKSNDSRTPNTAGQMLVRAGRNFLKQKKQQTTFETENIKASRAPKWHAVHTNVEFSLARRRR